MFNFFGNLAETFKGLSWWSKSIKLCSYLLLSSRSCYMLFFCHFCLLLLFWCSSISWEPLNCLTSYFNKWSWYYSEGYLTKETFRASPRLLRTIFKYLGPILGHVPLFCEGYSLSHLAKFCIDVFCISSTINVQRKISQHESFYLGLYTAYFGYILQYL